MTRLFTIHFPIKANPLRVTSGDDEFNTRILESIYKQISAITGGLTATKSEGYWIDDKGELVMDINVTVSTICSKDQCSLLEDLVSGWCENLRQDALVYTVQTTIGREVRNPRG